MPAAFNPNVGPQQLIDWQALVHHLICSSRRRSTMILNPASLIADWVWGLLLLTAGALSCP